MRLQLLPTGLGCALLERTSEALMHVQFGKMRHDATTELHTLP